MKIKLSDEREVGILFRYDLKSTVKHTRATLTIGEQSHEGVAMVHPKEQPIRRIGRKVALARAMRAAGLDEKARREIWAGLVSKGMRLARN